ncbi:MAG: suppressor of fused domain protein [Pirellulales bacterium]
MFHSSLPLALGGNADVLAFSKHLDGMVYVTADLTGKPEESETNYELMIVHRTRLDWGPRILSQSAPYAIENPIHAEQSMDIGSATPETSAIKGFVFATYGTFRLFEQDCELRLCLGITEDELAFKHEHGAERLLTLLKRNGVYPYTDFERTSVPLDA